MVDNSVFLTGIETLEYAPASPIGVIAEGAWKKIHNITEQSVKYTEAPLTKTPLKAEDKALAVLNFYAPADEGNVFTLGVLDENPELLQELYNIDYAPATSTMLFEADRKIANLAFRITTQPAHGKKVIGIYYNTEVQTVSDGNLTKNDVEKKVLTATILPFTPAGKTKAYTHSKQTVLADGTVIDSTVV